MFLKQFHLLGNEHRSSARYLPIHPNSASVSLSPTFYAQPSSHLLMIGWQFLFQTEAIQPPSSALFSTDPTEKCPLVRAYHDLTLRVLGWVGVGYEAALVQGLKLTWFQQLASQSVCTCCLNGSGGLPGWFSTWSSCWRTQAGSPVGSLDDHMSPGQWSHAVRQVYLKVWLLLFPFNLKIGTTTCAEFVQSEQN